ncbi:MAG: B12-binding domain-containing radical SAM protein [Deltaproteobacteria bacterium]|nr:MAG: B12-binding domain-containing radical SAM protein [Deltaproteobacteria bacterium]
MRIHLISPTHYRPDGGLHKTTRYWTSGITLPYLKALTPPPHEVAFTDELMADLDLAAVERTADVVGLTAMGPQIRRAYDLADHFRARGKRVVLGGTWVTLAAEESLQHADAVVAGEAEHLWPEVLADLEAGRSQGIYRATRWHDLRDLPVIDYWTLPLLKPAAFRSSWLYRMYFFWPIFFSRGCPHPCEYCAIQTYYDRTFRTRPVDDVIADVRHLATLGARRLLLLDDNPIGRPEAAKELFRRLIPERVQWVSQTTINIARDPELLDLTARSGARVLSIGFESLSEESLSSVGKQFNRPSRFAEDIRKLRARGIQVIALVIVGLDGDTTETFAATLRWLEENKISFLKLFTPAPYPGTKFHADMAAAGRIMTGDWGRYDYGSATVRPLQMTPEQMLDGFRTVYAGFYSVRSMLLRFLPPPRKNLLESLAMLVANGKVNRYLSRSPDAWGTIS